MKRTLGLFACAVVAAVAVAQTGSTVIQAFSEAISSAKSLSANYTVQAVGGVSAKYSVSLAKPNKVRLESANELIVADGEKITTLLKSEGKFYTRKQSDGDARALLAGEGFNFWAGFFDANAYKAPVTRDIAGRERNGETLSGGEAVYGAKFVRYFVSPQDKIARQATVDVNAGGQKSSTVMNAREVAVNPALPEATFTFSAPKGAVEVAEAEWNAAQFLTDLDEAKKVAAKSGKKIFVDFFAVWCGPCKLLDKEVFTTAKFKALGKKYVFLRIDVDRQKSIAEAYKIEAMPTQMVLDKDGQILKSTVGYANPSAFFQWLEGTP